MRAPESVVVLKWSLRHVRGRGGKRRCSVVMQQGTDEDVMGVVVVMAQSLFCPVRFVKVNFDHSIYQSTDTFLLQDLLVRSSRVVTGLQSYYFQEAKPFHSLPNVTFKTLSGPFAMDGTGM